MRRTNDQCFHQATEVEVEEHEDDEQSHRHNDCHSRLGALHVLELAAPLGVEARRYAHAFGNVVVTGSPPSAVVIVS